MSREIDDLKNRIACTMKKDPRLGNSPNDFRALESFHEEEKRLKQTIKRSEAKVTDVEEEEIKSEALDYSGSFDNNIDW